MDNNSSPASDCPPGYIQPPAPALEKPISSAEATSKQETQKNFSQNNYTRRNNYSNYNNNNNNNSNNNNSNYNNNGNNYNNNRGRGRGGARGGRGGYNNKHRQQDKARANLVSELVKCDLPRVHLSADSKVYKQVIVVGKGPLPSRSSVVAINYVGRLPDGSIFDSFVDPQLPTFMNINRATLTPAMELCIMGMNVGEKCLLTTSFEYGYGLLGCPPRIPAEANLQYEIELFGITKEFSSLDDGTVAGKLAVAEEAKSSGNHFFHLKMYRAAVHFYKQGESRLGDLMDCGEEDQQKIDAMLVLLNLNLAASALQCKFYEIAMINCDKVLSLDPNNIKGLFRLSQAFAGIGDFVQAKQQIVKAIKLKPNDLSLRGEYDKLVQRHHKNDGGMRGYFNKENKESFFTEKEYEDMKQDRICLADARVFF